MYYFQKTIAIFLIASNSALCLSQEISTSILTSPPIDIPIYLAGNFAEIRTNHFHSGIDIKTQSVIRKEIHAPEEGYVSRIYTSTTGYGQAIFITHPSGYRTVYAHLDEFPPGVKEYVKDYQYKKEQQTFDIFPTPDLFPVKKGDLIGYTGNTGGSSGPHLHYEIRDVRNEHPMNALLFLKITDNIAPVFYNVCFYPLDSTSLVENKFTKSLFKTQGSNRKYKILGKDTILVNGKFGIGFEAYDYVNGSKNTCGIYSVNVIVDSSSIYYQEMNDFSFYETRYINSFIDYEERIKTNKRIQKTFIEPNNKLSIYKNIIDNGEILFKDSLSHKISIIIKDANSNKSELFFFVRDEQKRTKKYKPLPKHFVKYMSWKNENSFISDNVKLILPEKSLYKDLHFTYFRTAPVKNSYSSVYHIHNKFTPLQQWGTLTIKPDSIPQKYINKSLLAFVDNNNKLSYAGGKWDNGFVTCKIRSLGNFTITIDTMPPTIRPINISKDKNMSNLKMIKFNVKDEFSGIKSYNGYIDSKWVLFEYDPRNNSLTYTFDPKRLERGKSHELELYIEDNKNNLQSFQSSFVW